MKIIEMLFEIILTAVAVFGMSFVSYLWAAEFKQFITRAFVYGLYWSFMISGAVLTAIDNHSVLIGILTLFKSNVIALLAYITILAVLPKVHRYLD